MQLTVMPKVASSSATVLVSPGKPVLGGDIGGLERRGDQRCAEAMLMMRPHLRAFMPGIAARMVWNAADRLMAMIAFHFSIGKSSIGETY